MRDDLEARAALSWLCPKWMPQMDVGRGASPDSVKLSQYHCTLAKRRDDKPQQHGDAGLATCSNMHASTCMPFTLVFESQCFSTCDRCCARHSLRARLAIALRSSSQRRVRPPTTATAGCNASCSSLARMGAVTPRHAARRLATQSSSSSLLRPRLRCSNCSKRWERCTVLSRRQKMLLMSNARNRCCRRVSSRDRQELSV